jgi:seryl-tRNA synthetase
VNRKELSEVVAEAAARTERAAALQHEARARQEAATARLQEAEAQLKDHVRRMEEMIAEDKRWTKRIFAELDDQRDERRALIEALLRLTDRLPPAPPDLRSA